MELDKLKYPIGKFTKPDLITAEIVSSWIDEIEMLPRLLRRAVNRLSDVELDTSYRPQGWTIRQVVHHLPDSHMNSYIRFRWALTEDTPTIKIYHEEKWAELADAKSGKIGISLILLEAIHIRWTMLLHTLSPDQLSRCFVHPENGKKIRLDENIGLYAWHGKHHLAHITNCVKNFSK